MRILIKISGTNNVLLVLTLGSKGAGYVVPDISSKLLKHVIVNIYLTVCTRRPQTKVATGIATLLVVAIRKNSVHAS